MTKVNMNVNGKAVSADVPDQTLLSEFLRENLRLTGTHIGCDTSQCGACVVHIDGKSVKSCSTLAVSLEGADVTTIEGLASGGELHPMQVAFNDNHGLQCGFCTPGFLTSARAFLNVNPHPPEQEIRLAIAGNLCRCTGYDKIVRAIQDAAQMEGFGSSS